ncbi:hypothetical protein [Sphingomonas sp. UNC305MFCol5.2]|uniref:hypothetical protein n=1 Tax=Sphingomonas sp. UNC305MFCol5.2 TaxID=1449076 RepID=UPI0012DDA08C|nr:hypothetical protein [Sphingomonas sp. UNC305MFCol5.2]
MIQIASGNTMNPIPIDHHRKKPPGAGSAVAINAVKTSGGTAMNSASKTNRNLLGGTLPTK